MLTMMKTHKISNTVFKSLCFRVLAVSGNFPGIKESQLQKVFGNVHFVSLHETRRNHASRHWRAHVTVAEGLDTPRKMKKREHRAQSKARAKEREREPLRGCALKPGGRKRERERDPYGTDIVCLLYCTVLLKRVRLVGSPLTTVRHPRQKGRSLAELLLILLCFAVGACYCCVVAPDLPCRFFTPGFPVTYGGAQSAGARDPPCLHPSERKRESDEWFKA